MTNPDKKNNSNSGFVLGMIIGATVGAISAMLVHKSDEKEVIQNFDSKVKDFFSDLMNGIKNKKEDISKKIEFIDAEPEPEEKPVSSPKKTQPKMFVKPKR